MQAMDVLQQISNDPELTLRRFSGNVALLTRFMKKFPSDTTFDQLLKAMDQDDYPSAEGLAHTMKGISGNLGFTSLYETSHTLVELLRYEDYSTAKEYFNNLQRIYHTVISLLEDLD